MVKGHVCVQNQAQICQYTLHNKNNKLDFKLKWNICAL